MKKVKKIHYRVIRADVKTEKQMLDMYSSEDELDENNHDDDEYNMFDSQESRDEEKGNQE